MRITIETTEAERRAVSLHHDLGQAMAAPAAAADADGGPASAALVMALGGEATTASMPGADGATNAGGPPTWLEEMIASLRRPLP